MTAPMPLPTVPTTSNHVDEGEGWGCLQRITGRPTPPWHGGWAEVGPTKRPQKSGRVCSAIPADRERENAYFTT